MKAWCDYCDMEVNIFDGVKECGHSGNWDEEIEDFENPDDIEEFEDEDYQPLDFED